MRSAPHRRTHYLRRNERSETIHQCVWYDCETEPRVREDGTIEHHLVFGWAVYRRRSQRGEWESPVWFRFTTGEQLWTWICSHTRKRKTLYVWAHNQSFDFVSASGMHCLTRAGYSMASAIVDSPPFIMRWRLRSSQLVVTDTLNIWRMSLKQMGKMTGLAKLEMPASWTQAASDDDYCRRDVEIIMHAVCEWADFLRANDMGKMQLTVAGQAMQTFRHRYLRDDILIDCNENALRIARAAYHGGRVECFRIGTYVGPLYLLDVNSLYPYVMREHDYPLRLIATTGKISIAEAKDLIARYCLCARVRVNLREPCLPLLREHKLIFPIGQFETHVSTPELSYLIATDQLVSIEETAVYERGRPFVAYVDDLYSRRLAERRRGNETTASHYKLLLNSFYGKWGQNGRKWTDVGPAEDDDIRFMRSVDAQTGEVVNYRSFGGRLQRRETLPESASSHPAIAAHITAHARMVLWALMRQATREEYLYCDTDSILVSVNGLQHLRDAIDDERLGGLKLVREIGQLTLYGCKDYVIDGCRVTKGVRDTAVDLGQGRFSQLRWTSFRGGLRRGSLLTPTSHEIIKRLRRIYDKGIVRADGFVLPFHLDSFGAGNAGDVGARSSVNSASS